VIFVDLMRYNQHQCVSIFVLHGMQINVKRSSTLTLRLFLVTFCTVQFHVFIYPIMIFEEFTDLHSKV
jgi:hypothetical protein